jgi:hypothetical protein
MSENLPVGQNLASGKRVVAAGLCSAIAFRLKAFGQARDTDRANREPRRESNTQIPEVSKCRLPNNNTNNIRGRRWT